MGLISVGVMILPNFYLLSQHLHLYERRRIRFPPPNKTFRKPGIHVQAFSWEKMKLSLPTLNTHKVKYSEIPAALLV